MNKKIKVLTLSDHPLSPSGVGTQTKNVCEALLKTGKFSIISLGGAIKHQSYDPVRIEPYQDDWTAIPVDGYGSPEMIRSVIRTEQPDILWFMTDPRFWGWLWDIENEVRSLIPMVYYHVWDNKPYPYFNRNFYLSNDHVVTISKVTDDIVRTVAPEVDCTYLPHAVDHNVFNLLDDQKRQEIRSKALHPDDQDKTVFFWNNRNARRKQSGTLIWWFKEWLDKRNMHDKAQLIMHTDPGDQHGQDLHHIINHLGMSNRQVMLSVEKIPPEHLAAMYGMVDCVINISDAEGFGLSTLEALSCGTPIIATMTGGLQEQITDGTQFFGEPIFPISKSIIGSQQVPYIYEDRISKEHFFSAMDKIQAIGTEGRRALGLKGRQHVMENYNFDDFATKWVDLMTNVYEKHGSWSERKNYSSIRFKEIT